MNKFLNCNQGSSGAANKDKWIVWNILRSVFGAMPRDEYQGHWSLVCNPKKRWLVRCLLHVSMPLLFYNYPKCFKLQTASHVMWPQYYKYGHYHDSITPQLWCDYQSHKSATRWPHKSHNKLYFRLQTQKILSRNSCNAHCDSHNTHNCNNYKHHHIRGHNRNLKPFAYLFIWMVGDW